MPTPFQTDADATRFLGDYARGMAKRLCPHCAAGASHHTNAADSIGGADRHPIYDIHAVEDTGGVGLTECLAGDVLLDAERRGWL